MTNPNQMIYLIFYSNFGYYKEISYSSLHEALEAGKRDHFEFRIEECRSLGRVIEPVRSVTAWSPISGLRFLTDDPEIRHSLQRPARLVSALAR